MYIYTLSLIFRFYQESTRKEVPQKVWKFANQKFPYKNEDRSPGNNILYTGCPTRVV